MLQHPVFLDALIAFGDPKSINEQVRDTASFTDITKILSERWKAMEAFVQQNYNTTDIDEDDRDLLQVVIDRARSEVSLAQAVLTMNASLLHDKIQQPVSGSICSKTNHDDRAAELYYKLEVRPLGKGVFVYKTLEQAARNRPHLPVASKLRGVPRVVLCVRPIGRPRLTKSNKVAFEAVLPERVIRQVFGSKRLFLP